MLSILDLLHKSKQNTFAVYSFWHKKGQIIFKEKLALKSKKLNRLKRFTKQNI